MEIEPELIAFLAAAKRLENKQLLKEISTEELKALQYEIADDPDIKKDLKKIFK